MKKNVFGRQLKRDKNERTALFKGLISSLVLHGSIKTTESKAKAIKGRVDKLITRAKKGGINAAHFVAPFVAANALEKLISDVAPRFVNRPGGYTRIIKLGNRMHDGASMVVLELVEQGQKAIVAKETLIASKDNKKEEKQEKISSKGRSASSRKITKTSTKEKKK